MDFWVRYQLKSKLGILAHIKGTIDIKVIKYCAWTIIDNET